MVEEDAEPEEEAAPTLQDLPVIDGPTIPELGLSQQSLDALRPTHRPPPPKKSTLRRVAPPVAMFVGGFVLVTLGVLTGSSVWQGLAGLPGLVRDSAAHGMILLGAWQLAGVLDRRVRGMQRGIGAGVFVAAFLASVALNFVMAPSIEELAQVAETEDLLEEGELMDARTLFANREVLCADAPRERVLGLVRRLHERGAVQVYADPPIVVGDVRVVETLRIEMPEEEGHRTAIRSAVTEFLGHPETPDEDLRYWSIPCGSPD